MTYVLKRVFKNKETIIGVYENLDYLLLAHYNDQCRIYEADGKEGVKPMLSDCIFRQWSGWVGNNHYTYKVEDQD